MRKIIVLSVVLALAAGAAFAEVSVGAAVQAGATAVQGSSKGGSKLVTSGFNGGRLQGDYTNDEGTFGASTKIWIGDYEHWANTFAYAWWKPVSQIRVFGGRNSFGEFGINYIVGWGWHASDAEDYVAYNGYGFTRSSWAYSGWDATGFALTLAPVTGLAINVAVPYGTEEKEAEDVYKNIVGQLTYDIASVGQIGLTYDSGAGYTDGPEPKNGTYLKESDGSFVNSGTSTWASGSKPADAAVVITEPIAGDPVEDPGIIYAQFHLTAVQNLDLNIGLKYTLAGKAKKGNATDKTTYTPPINAGLGLNYTISDTIGVKARLAAAFAGSTKTGDTTTDDPLHLGFDVMPYFDLSILKLFLNLGVEFTAEQEGTADSQVFAWYFNPYITKSAGSATFYAGFQLYSDGGPYDKDEKKNKDAVITWAVPVGLQLTF
jgi:hypothetical protein